MARLDLLRWKSTVKRILASASNLEKQKATYENGAEETIRGTEQLREVLSGEMKLLEQRQRERERMIECDAVAAKITAKGVTKAELDE